ACYSSCLYYSFCCSLFFFFFSSRRRHTRSKRDWSSDVCSSDLLFLRYENYCQLNKCSSIFYLFLFLLTTISIFLHSCSQNNQSNIDYNSNRIYQCIRKS